MSPKMYGLCARTESSDFRSNPFTFHHTLQKTIHKPTYLYLTKKLGGSKSFSHVALPSMISSVMARPCLNSSCTIVRVDIDTLNVEFCCGYAGVIMGIRW